MNQPTPEEQQWSPEAAKQREQARLKAAVEQESPEDYEKGQEALLHMLEGVDPEVVEGMHLEQYACVEPVDIDERQYISALRRTDSEDNPYLDYGWLKSSDMIWTRNGVLSEVGLFSKVDAKTGKVLFKVANLAAVQKATQQYREAHRTAEAPQAPAVEAAQRMIETEQVPRAEAVEDLAEEAVERVVKQPETEQTNKPEATDEQEKPETEQEMYKRFIRETQTELSALYAEHRKHDPRSSEAAGLELRIKAAKEDIGKYMSQAEAARQAGR